MLVDFNTISDESRLWIYGSESKLTDYQQKIILNKISEYLKNWDYHNNSLTSAVRIKENHFIVIALDDSKFGVGGCSIDSLQRIIQELERDFNISLLNRLNVFCKRVANSIAPSDKIFFCKSFMGINRSVITFESMMELSIKNLLNKLRSSKSKTKN